MLPDSERRERRGGLTRLPRCESSRRVACASSLFPVHGIHYTRRRLVHSASAFARHLSGSDLRRHSSADGPPRGSRLVSLLLRAPAAHARRPYRSCHGRTSSHAHLFATRNAHSAAADTFVRTSKRSAAGVQALLGARCRRARSSSALEPTQHGMPSVSSRRKRLSVISQSRGVASMRLAWRRPARGSRSCENRCEKV